MASRPEALGASDLCPAPSEQAQNYHDAMIKVGYRLAASSRGQSDPDGKRAFDEAITRARRNGDKYVTSSVGEPGVERLWVIEREGPKEDFDTTQTSAKVGAVLTQ